MRRAKKLIVNVLLLSITALLLRFIGLYFNIWLTKRIGAEGIGLYSLVMSAGAFAVTLAVSGINLASTKMAAEALGRNSESEMRGVMLRCIVHALFFGLLSAAIFFIFAGFIGKTYLGDIRAVMPLRIFSLAMPPLAISSALNGYFTAVRRVYKSASSQIFEELSKILIIMAALAFFPSFNIEQSCIFIAAGAVISEFLSFGYTYLLYRIDKKRHRIGQGEKSEKLTKTLLGISLPIAASSYVRSALLSVEHMLIPRGLRKRGASAAVALSSYGVFSGMVLPVILFPQAFIAAFSSLLVPEMAESAATGKKDRIDECATRSVQAALAFAIGCAGVLLCFSEELGMIIYDSAEAGKYIKLLSPLVPVMYLDTVVDGMLKGLGEQLYSMKVNIFDASLSVVLVYFLVPVFGIAGYAAVVIVCEIINCSLSICRLFTVCELKIRLIKFVAGPLFCVIGATSAVRAAMYFITDNTVENGMILTAYITAAAFLYIVFLRMTRCLAKSDIIYLKNAVR